MASLKDTKAKLRLRALGCIVTGLAGILFVILPENTFDDWSFDLPFRWRANLEATNAVIVYIDSPNAGDASAAQGPPDRTNYVTLLNRMKDAGAELVFFDCDFSDSHPASDLLFSNAIRENGRVILGGIGGNDVSQQTGTDAGVAGGTVQSPTPTLAGAVTSWGMLRVAQSLSDQVVRRLLTEDNKRACSVFLAAKMSNFNGKQNAKHWINYYGPAHYIESVLLSTALTETNETQFRHKAVFVGGGNAGTTQDHHLTPYSGDASSGVEILATSYINLVRTQWLDRVSLAAQGVFVAVWGALATAVFLCFRPRHVLWLMPLVMALPLVAGFWTQWEMRQWWSWGICSFLQTPVAAAWAMYANRWFPWPALAFISYRRVEGEGGGYAQAFWSALEQRGCGAICDVKAELTTAPFLPQLLGLIDSVPNVIIVLSPNSLDAARINRPTDVFRAEIRRALDKGKNIIPVMIGDFKMPPAEQLPEDIRALPGMQAFARKDDDPWGVMDKIMSNLRRPILLGRWWHRTN